MGARLIEAEAALQAHDTTTWLSKLNIPRADATLLPVPLDTTYLPVTGTTLAPLTDPGTDAGRAKLMFSERAFWMFSTGHRLGDMRREVRQYSTVFSVNTVYPVGDRKSTRLNSSHSQISYAVFCLKKKNNVWGEHIIGVLARSL